MKCKIGHDSPGCRPTLLSRLSSVYGARASNPLGTGGPTQAEKTAKISVMVTRHAGAVATSTDFWLFLFFF